MTNWQDITEFEVVPVMTSADAALFFIRYGDEVLYAIGVLLAVSEPPKKPDSGYVGCAMSR
jgi:hypothetical protein